MNPEIYKSGAFTLKKGETAALEGKDTDSLMLLLQGKLDVFITPSGKKLPENYADLENTCYRIFELDQNIFIGAGDMLQNGRNSLSFSAASECGMFRYETGNLQNTLDLIQTQKDYGTYTINSLCNLIINSYQALEKLSSEVLKLIDTFENLSVFYYKISNECGLEAVPCGLADKGGEKLGLFQENNIEVPLHFNRQFTETSFFEPNDNLSVSDEVLDNISYFTHLYNLSADVKKAFFSADRYIAENHLKASSACLGQVLAKLRQAFSLLEETTGLFYGDNEDCAYKVFLKAAGEMNKKGLDQRPALDAAVYIHEKLRRLVLKMKNEFRHKAGIDLKYFDHLHKDSVSALNYMNNDDGTSDIESGGRVLSIPEELINSAVRIVEYSELPEEKATCFLMNLTAFRNLQDRMSSDDTSQNIRKSVSKIFFEIYRAVFLKAHKLKDNSRLIKMFLNYGYMDEKLLDPEQVLALYKIAGMEKPGCLSNIYYADGWLSKIYDLEKEPSINQFELDYSDIFRDLKKRGQVDEKDKAAYDNDKEGKLAFETENMFRTNHKLCQGQITIYFPILHRDMAPVNPLRSVVTPEIIREKLGRILEIDYSAFHREIYYMNSKKNIEKELVMMQVMPDIILMPVYGSRAIMWQEITGRVRSSPGRLLVPVFTDDNLDDMLVRLVGNFRWELCRTMMGVVWNDVTQPSLTSEYTDYIQFYRKNRDLSDEAKDKIKSQCSKYHGKMRDIFTSDYELWINNESKGNARLNKVARSIFIKYCPFSRSIREQLEKSPMFVDMIMMMKKHHSKLARELENHYRIYCKNNDTLDTVLENNLRFYRDM